jgi:hypothetical protein
MNVLEHGFSVSSWFYDLFYHLKYKTPLYREWRLPEWCTADILPKLLPLHILVDYQIWHDIGKPYCRTVDDEGKQHFPNHAQVSYDTWIANCHQTEDNLLVGQLILKDMLAHTVKGEDLTTFLADPLAPSLVVTALCEIHSNASALGQLDSDMFKIKLKRLDKIGRKLFNKT